MSKLTRVTQMPFGTSGPSGDFGAFGSKAVNPSSPIFTQNPVTIQSLAPFLQGWGLAIVGNYEPALEDMNGLFLLAFYQLGYLLQQGIPEYDPGTTYFTNSVCQTGGQVYTSLVDNNIGHSPTTSFSQWQSGLPGAELTGAMKPYAGTVAPSGYLVCNGTAINRVTFAALFNVCGTSYGIGDGTTTFNLPDLRGKIPIALNTGDPNFGTVGVSGGSVVMTIEQMPAHTHDIGGIEGTNISGGGQNLLSPASGNISGSTGEGEDFIPPYQTIGCYIIKT